MDLYSSQPQNEFEEMLHGAGVALDIEVRKALQSILCVTQMCFTDTKKAIESYGSLEE